MDNVVRALAILPNGDVVAGGDFVRAGDEGSAFFARFTFDCCPADTDRDGYLTGIDFDLFVYAFEDGEIEADFDGDGFVNGLDFDLFVYAYEVGC